MGGFNFVAEQGRLRVVVQPAAVQLDSRDNIIDPVDLKATPDGHLYVLSRSTATLTEYDASWNVVRSMPSIGATPTGLDVDSAGKVYVALSGNHQVARFRPTATAFELDPNFNGTGRIGKSDQTPGSGNAQFNAPFDVAVSPSDQEIYVSDSNNHRIQKFDAAGNFVLTFGGFGGVTFGQLNTPKGLTFGESDTLHIIDSGNNRLVLAQGEDVTEIVGGTGTSFGLLQSAQNLSVGSRGLYITEPPSHRIRKFDSGTGGHLDLHRFEYLCTLSAQLGLLQPASVSAVEHLLEERIYIADTGHNRILLVKLPLASSQTPDAVWNSMVQQIALANIEGALSYFSTESVESFRQAFLEIPNGQLLQWMSEIGPITAVFIENDSAEYIFEQIIGAETLGFPIEFVRENGIWKILEF
jgi:hypothetical protein